MNPLEIPEIVIRRLPLYLRTLNLIAEQGQTVTSSQEIGERLGISSTQIRKDLSYFGEFGKQGTGYNVQHLREQLQQILQVSQRWKVVLIGAGDLGRAIMRYSGFEDGGFEITAVLDKDKQKIGRQIGKLQVLDAAKLHEVIEEQGIRIAIIAVPADEAQDVADALANAGIKAILSYAPIPLRLPPHVRVHYIDPVIGLQSMTYYLNPE
ncbi:MAG: redox-sensing transcriptional repressor Rex [Anaerolineae bacterium]